MSAIKDGRFPITLDKERHLLFSLNVIDEMQDKFGGFDKLDKALSGKDSVKNLRWLLTLLLNEGADDGGRDYLLPEGYAVDSEDGAPFIRGKGRCVLQLHNGLRSRKR